MANNGLKPGCWGPTAWHFLHSVAMGYPETITNTLEDKEIAQKYKMFFESLEFVLPCDWCKVHYKENLKSLPIANYLDTRRNLSLWVYKLHNLVNDETNVKESERPSFENVYELYDGYRAPCDEDSKTCGGDVEDTCKIIIQDINSNCSGSIGYWPFMLLLVLLIFGVTVSCLNMKKKKK